MIYLKAVLVIIGVGIFCVGVGFGILVQRRLTMDIFSWIFSFALLTLLVVFHDIGQYVLAFLSGVGVVIVVNGALDLFWKTRPVLRWKQR